MKHTFSNSCRVGTTLKVYAMKTHWQEGTNIDTGEGFDHLLLQTPTGCKHTIPWLDPIFLEANTYISK